MSIMLKYHLLFLWIQYFVTLYTQQILTERRKKKNIYIYIYIKEKRDLNIFIVHTFHSSGIWLYKKCENMI